MTAAETTRQEIADCFRKARWSIASHDHLFICHAINSTEQGPVRNVCKKIISDGIDGAFTFPIWLLKTYPDIYQGKHTGEIDDLCRLARLAWLDKLIEEYSE